jgi:hypothetical protein
MAAKKSPTKSKSAVSTTKPKARQLKKSSYKSLRLSKRLKPITAKKLSSAPRLFRNSLAVLKQHWRLFGSILVVYAVLNLVLVRSFSAGTDIRELKDLLLSESGSGGEWGTGLVLFSYLIGSNGSVESESGGLYQTMLIVIVGLALVWALRQVHAGAKPKMRQAFYQGMYPLVPFLLVTVVILIQLVPLIIGATVYSAITSNNIAVTAPEQLIWALIFFLLVLLSLYMICSSLFALYIVMLPDMTPMKALRSARQLVMHRRWLVLRKVAFLPVILLLIAAAVMVPLIVLAAPLAVWGFFVLSVLGLAVTHSYLYSLYRELL